MNMAMENKIGPSPSNANSSKFYFEKMENIMDMSCPFPQGGGYIGLYMTLVPEVL